jgi:hypothetical protein
MHFTFGLLLVEQYDASSSIWYEPKQEILNSRLKARWSLNVKVSLVTIRK